MHVPWHWGAFVQPLLWWKNNTYYILWVCVCSLRYLAWNAIAPFYNPLACPHYNISPTLSHKRYYCRKKLLSIRGSAGKSLARPTSRCRRKGIDSVFGKSVLFMCRIPTLFLLQRLKGSTSGNTPDFSNMETRAVIRFFSCKSRRRMKFTPFWQNH